MKQINLFKILFVAVLFGIGGTANAQIHPLAFGSYTLGAGTTNANWYANYVGLRLEVITPAFDAGNKVYKTANDGTGASGNWGGAVTTPIVAVPVVMPQSGDSACSLSPIDHSITTNMTGKIGLVYRGASIDFGDKAFDCQNAGAVACVIINNVPGGPVGMSEAYLSGAPLGSVTIPVFMISQADGHILDSLYNAGIAATITITTWGQNLNNDLGFVPGGAAMWHNYAIPSNQLGTSGNPTAYNMLDGAFIANYGNNPAYGVQLKTTTSFTPTGGSTTTQHTSEVDLSGAFDNSTTTNDSIWAMFSTAEYALSASGTGRFDVNYVIESDSADQFPADNSQTVSFYVDDSVYSKGTYDFVNNWPTRTIYEAFGGGIEFLWGPMYYVANAGTTLSSVQFSLAINGAAGTVSNPLPTDVNIYVFKWTDGVGGVADSIVANGELQLVGSGTRHVNGTTDTSEALLWQQIYTDTNGNNTGPQLALDANSWYYVCVDVPPANFMGCDGVLDPYPRVYGRYQANVGASGNHLLDYSGIEYSGTKVSLDSFGGSGNAPVPAFSSAYINSVDSFVFNNMQGLIPAVAMIANNSPTSVKTVVGKPLADVNLFPNPAKDQLTVTASFSQVEKTVSYEIIDGLARFISKDTHNNVQNDNYTINTSALAAGNYYLIINAEGRAMTRKFVVIK